jgi:hypothetical protein
MSQDNTILSIVAKHATSENTDPVSLLDGHDVSRTAFIENGYLLQVAPILKIDLSQNDQTIDIRGAVADVAEELGQFGAYIISNYSRDQLASFASEGVTHLTIIEDGRCLVRFTLPAPTTASSQSNLIIAYRSQAPPQTRWRWWKRYLRGLAVFAVAGVAFANHGLLSGYFPDIHCPFPYLHNL